MWGRGRDASHWKLRGREGPGGRGAAGEGEVLNYKSDELLRSRMLLGSKVGMPTYRLSVLVLEAVGVRAEIKKRLCDLVLLREV